MPKLNSVQTILPYLFELNFNVMLISVPRSPMWKFFSNFYDQNWTAVCVYILLHISYACCIPSHSTLPLHITIWISLVKLRIMYFLTLPFISILLLIHLSYGQKSFKFVQNVCNSTNTSNNPRISFFKINYLTARRSGARIPAQQRMFFFPYPFRPVLEPTQPQGYLGSLPSESGKDMKLTTQLHIVQRLRVRATLPEFF